MKYNQVIFANALGLTTAIVFVACRILVGIFPDLSFTVAQSWFHGIQLSPMAAWNLNWSGFILGIVSSAITAWLIGYLFAGVYNMLAKK